MVSIYIIGSVARQTGDILSDKDLLAVGSDVEIKDAVSQYVDIGWNVAQYTRHEFEEMAKSQSLFVQHVKQDGRVVRDDNGYLRTVLDCYKISKNYYRDLSAAIEPIYSIGEAEKSYWGLLFQSDILYVSIRNACIFHRATDTSTDFDFTRLVQWVCRVVGLTNTDSDLLLCLRTLKHAYRTRTTDAEVSQIQQIIAVSKKLFDYWDDISCSSSMTRKQSNGYFEMRYLERQLVTTVGPIYMDSLNRSHELSDLWSRICNAGPYDKPKLECLPRWSEQVATFLSSQHYH